MLSSYPKVEVVAPISAPILQIVPLPVQLMATAPSPKYSTTAPVPPFTVRIPATFKITSLGAVQPLSLPVSFTPISLGIFSVAIGTNHHTTGESVVFQHHLVNDTGTGLPKANAIFIRNRSEEIVHFFAFVYRTFEVYLAVVFGHNQVVAVYGAGHGYLGTTGLHKLEQRHLGGGILHGYTVRCKIYVVFATGKS